MVATMKKSLKEWEIGLVVNAIIILKKLSKIMRTIQIQDILKQFDYYKHYKWLTEANGLKMMKKNS